MGAKLGGGTGTRGRSRRSIGSNKFTEINVTPFVDVMLVLLVIFMVAAPMMTTGVTVDLPKSKASSVPGTDEPLSVSIKANQAIYIQDTEVSIETLGPKITNIVGEKKDTRIFVRGDKNIDYGFVMRVIGELNAAGLTKVALITTSAGASTSPKK